jgi:LacI family transcriptional regulator
VLDDDIAGAPHDSVIIDQQHGTRALIRHVLDHAGATRIIFVGGPATNVDSLARLEECQRVLNEAGLLLAREDIHHLDYQYDTAYRLARQRVRQWVGAGHCVFAANDEMAAGVVAAASEAGVAVPKDLAVVGFDDTRIARMTRPALTTVRVPMSRMGSEAIKLLCRRISEPKAAPMRISLKPELIVRESCGARSR